MKILILGVLLICLNGFTGSTFDTITKFLSLNNYKWYRYYSIGLTVSLIRDLQIAFITPLIFYSFLIALCNETLLSLSFFSVLID